MVNRTIVGQERHDYKIKEKDPTQEYMNKDVYPARTARVVVPVLTTENP